MNDDVHERRAVFDCNVYLQALISPQGPAGSCVAAVLDGRVLWVSTYVFREIRRVAAYPHLVQRFSELTADRVQELISQVEAVATVVRDVPQHFQYPRDPADAHYIDLAVLADATWRVTRDNDLHDLLTDHSIAGKQFRQITRNQLRVVPPTEFVLAIDS